MSIKLSIGESNLAFLTKIQNDKVAMSALEKGYVLSFIGENNFKFDIWISPCKSFMITDNQMTTYSIDGTLNNWVKRKGKK